MVKFGSFGALYPKNAAFLLKIKFPLTSSSKIQHIITNIQKFNMRNFEVKALKSPQKRSFFEYKRINHTL
jgi:hypothetical protein